MAETWGATFKNSPDGDDSPSTLDDQQRTHRRAVEERMENEHDTFEDATSGLSTADWRHKEGSARVYYQSTEPTDQPGANGATLGASDDGRLWVDSDDNTIKVWDGTAFQITDKLDAILHVQHQESSGVNGGTATSGSWETRKLTTEITNDITGASLSTNQITLPAGTYVITSVEKGMTIDVFKSKLRNITDSSDTLIGMSARSSATDATTCQSSIYGEFTITGTKVFEIQHRVSATRGSQGYGVSCGFGVVEIYADVVIKKIS